MSDFIAEIFEQADITPEELRDDRELLEQLIERGVRISGGAADPHQLHIDLMARAAG